MTLGYHAGLREKDGSDPISRPSDAPAPSHLPSWGISASLRPENPGPSDFCAYDCLSKVIVSIGFSRWENQRYQNNQSGGAKTALDEPFSIVLAVCNI
jgi:hypothetical protein